MAKARPSVQKRQRERQRQERKQQKESRRQVRRAELVEEREELKAVDPSDPDIAGIVAGPQPKLWEMDEFTRYAPDEAEEEDAQDGAE